MGIVALCLTLEPDITNFVNKKLHYNLIKEKMLSCIKTAAFGLITAASA